VHSLQAGPLTDALALHAVRLITGSLAVCVQRGRDLEARGRMLVAATLAGQAFTNAMVCVVHALAHTLGGRFGVPHGLANAILLPFGMEYNLGHSAARYAVVAEAMGLRHSGWSDEEAARAAVQGVRELSLGACRQTEGNGRALEASGIAEAAVRRLIVTTRALRTQPASRSFWKRPGKSDARHDRDDSRHVVRLLDLGALGGLPGGSRVALPAAGPPLS
jgi:alcohol dehydrogenase class IV